MTRWATIIGLKLGIAVNRWYARKLSSKCRTYLENHDYEQWDYWAECSRNNDVRCLIMQHKLRRAHAQA